MDIHSLIEYIKQNIPSAEILKVSHTDRIFNQNGSLCDSSPTKEGIIILIPNEISANYSQKN